MYSTVLYTLYMCMFQVFESLITQTLYFGMMRRSKSLQNGSILEDATGVISKPLKDRGEESSGSIILAV